MSPAVAANVTKPVSEILLVANGIGDEVTMTKPKSTRSRKQIAPHGRRRHRSRAVSRQRHR
ncbi:hypothetical protein [Cyanobium sp. ATX-6F1]|uniref:hypothetical protein n=1 Tax=Cyanobium sp. ATX-6F1 TaxID=3137388 RepID=UPI0039BE6812